MQYMLYGMRCNNVCQTERCLYRIWFISDPRRLKGQKATHSPHYSIQHSRRCPPESGGWPERDLARASTPAHEYGPTDGQTLTFPQDPSEPTCLTTESSQCPVHTEIWTPRPGCQLTTQDGGPALRSTVLHLAHKGASARSHLRAHKLSGHLCQKETGNKMQTSHLTFYIFQTDWWYNEKQQLQEYNSSRKLGIIQRKNNLVVLSVKRNLGET